MIKEEHVLNTGALLGDEITTEKTRMVVTVRMVSVEVKLVELSVSCGVGVSPVWEEFFCMTTPLCVLSQRCLI